MSETAQFHAQELPEDEEQLSRHQRYYRQHREQILARLQAERDAHRVERPEPSEEELAQKRQAQREARRLKNQRYALRHPERRQAYRDRHKSEQKILNTTYYQANRQVIAEKQRIYQAQHKNEIAEYGRKYREDNKEDIRLRRQGRWLKNHETNLKRQRSKYQEHREKYLEATKQWQQANPVKVRDIKIRAKGRRRAREKGLPATFTAEEKAFMLQFWHNAWAACGNQEGFWHTLADDHWIPLSSSECPGTIATNMIPLCHGRHGCNNSKHGQDPDVWLSSRFPPAHVKRIRKAINAYFALVKLRAGGPPDAPCRDIQNSV